MLLNRLKYELSVFYQLHEDARKLVLSIFSVSVANSLLYVFANAYLFVSTQNLSSVAVFNLGSFFMIPLGFYLNAYLLRFLSVRKLFVPASVLQSGSLIILFFFNHLNLWSIFFVGVVSGFWNGLYWANRNYIYQLLTRDQERDYISGLLTMISNISGVILPLLAGWLIVWMRTQDGTNAKTAYLTITLFGITILLIGAYFLNSIKEFPKPKITKIFVKNPRQDWKLFRIFVLSSTFQMAVGATVAEIMTLLFLGNEGILGTLKSFLAIVLGGLTYIIGRKMRPKDRFSLLVFNTLPLLFSAIFLAVSFSQISLILYVMALTLSASIFWFAYVPIMARSFELQDGGQIKDNYVYILDHELFINLGRVVSLLFIWWAFNYWDNQASLTIVAAIGAVLQTLALFPVRKLLQRQNGA